MKNNTPIIEGYALYRKLTEKSRLGFGKFAELTIKDLLAIKQEDYLAYCYYSLPKISFTDDVLDRIGIAPADRIEKPGKDEEKLKAYRKTFSAQFTAEQKQNCRYLSARIRKRKDKAALVAVERDTHYTKGQLQSINHGRMKP